MKSVEGKGYLLLHTKQNAYKALKSLVILFIFAITVIIFFVCFYTVVVAALWQLFTPKATCNNKSICTVKTVKRKHNKNEQAIKLYLTCNIIVKQMSMLRATERDREREREREKKMMKRTLEKKIGKKM